MKAIVIGAGRAGYLHMSAFARLGVAVVALVDPSAQAARDLRFSDSTRIFGSVSQVPHEYLQDAIVSVCSPVQDHFKSAHFCLERGAHVMVEKPATQEERELRALYELAARQGRCFSPVHNQRFLPGYRRAREMVRSGKLGGIESVVRFMNFTHENVRMMDPEHWSHSLPGGRLFEANPHSLYLAHSMFPASTSWQLKAVTRDSDGRKWPNYPVTSFSAFLAAPGSTMTIHSSVCHEANGHLGSRFHADSGMLVIGHRGTLLATASSVGLLDRQGEVRGTASLIDHALAVRAKLLRRVKRDRPPPSGSGHLGFIEAFVDYTIQGKEDTLVPLEEGVFAQSMNRTIGEAVEAG